MSQGIITRLEAQKRNKERVNVYLDGDYAFSLTVIEAAKLRKGQVLSVAEIEQLTDVDAVNRAVDRAANFLSYRPRSIAEVRENLAGKDFSPEVIDAAVDRLKHLGYVDDRAFARFWIENRSTFKPRSSRALRYELRQKGLPDSVIDGALEAVDDTEAAFQAAQDRVRRLRGIDQTTFRNKLGSFLQRRGFNYDVIRTVVEQLIEDLSNDPDYFADEDPDA